MDQHRCAYTEEAKPEILFLYQKQLTVSFPICTAQQPCDYNRKKKEFIRSNTTLIAKIIVSLYMEKHEQIPLRPPSIRWILIAIHNCPYCPPNKIDSPVLLVL